MGYGLAPPYLLEVGNTATVKETAVGFSPDGGLGFETRARMISMEYNDLSNKTPLNLEVFFLEDENQELIEMIAESEILWER